MASRDPDGLKLRAEQADRILKDPLFGECVENLRSHYQDAWQRTMPSQVEEREEFYRMLILVDQLTLQFKKMLHDGQIVDIQNEKKRRAGLSREGNAR